MIRARAAEIAVIFRRGPTKQVRMIRWDMTRDVLQRGQWLAGRVYPERCDISPDGTYVIYFAMRRGDTFNAVCRPPWFTPLAVWEEGGTWGGGGVWVTNTELHLRANPAVMKVDPKFTLPPWLTLGWHTTNFDRDGWRAAESDAIPYVDSKLHPRTRTLELRRRVAIPIANTNTDMHAYDYKLIDHARDRERELFSADWADWHPSGDLAIARDGVLSRIDVRGGTLGEPVALADFTGEEFEAIEPPKEATIW